MAGSGGGHCVFWSPGDKRPDRQEPRPLPGTGPANVSSTRWSPVGLGDASIQPPAAFGHHTMGHGQPNRVLLPPAPAVPAAAGHGAGEGMSGPCRGEPGHRAARGVPSHLGGPAPRGRASPRRPRSRPGLCHTAGTGPHAGPRSPGPQPAAEPGRAGCPGAQDSAGAG